MIREVEWMVLAAVSPKSTLWAPGSHWHLSGGGAGREQVWGRDPCVWSGTGIVELRGSCPFPSDSVSCSSPGPLSGVFSESDGA